MNKRLLIVAPWAVIAIALIACASQPKEDPAPSTPGSPQATAPITTAPVTMSLANFNAIQTGMPLAEVERIAGGPGQVISTAGTGAQEMTMIKWDGHGGLGANANVTFQNGKVYAKAQFGLT